jgi:hypothetical protein
MKSLSMMLGLFFWGMVAKCLSELITVSVHFTQQLLAWSGYTMWVIALMLLIYQFFRKYRRALSQNHCKESTNER